MDAATSEAVESRLSNDEPARSERLREVGPAPKSVLLSSCACSVGRPLLSPFFNSEVVARPRFFLGSQPWKTPEANPGVIHSCLPLQDDRETLADADADRSHADTAASALQLVGQATDDSTARCS